MSKKAISFCDFVKGNLVLKDAKKKIKPEDSTKVKLDKVNKVFSEYFPGGKYRRLPKGFGK